MTKLVTTADSAERFAVPPWWTPLDDPVDTQQRSRGGTVTLVSQAPAGAGLAPHRFSVTDPLTCGSVREHAPLHNTIAISSNAKLDATITAAGDVHAVAAATRTTTVDHPIADLWSRLWSPSGAHHHHQGSAQDRHRAIQKCTSPFHVCCSPRACTLLPAPHCSATAECACGAPMHLRSTCAFESLCGTDAFTRCAQR